MRFFKSIRFKLTVWYSALLITLSLVFVISINIIITNHFQREPLGRPLLDNVREQRLEPRWKNLSNDKQQLMRDLRQQDLQTIRQISALSFVPLIALSFAGGYLISGQMLNPIKKINKATREITSKNLNKQIPHDDTGDELSELIQNFNQMRSRLQRAFDLQKQFVEDASHELKTPLAVVQTNLESAVNKGKVSKQEMKNLIKTALKSTKFMNKLIEDLLLLSILENQVNKEETNLRKIIISSINQLQHPAQNKNIKMKFSEKTANKPLVEANKTLIQRAIMNLLENSIKYSPKGGKVQIKLTEEKKHFSISIKDNGKGIPQEHQNKVFERFYRIDKSRSRKTGGTGLGLSITKKIIENHKGKIELESDKKGTKITIKIPKG